MNPAAEGTSVETGDRLSPVSPPPPRAATLWWLAPFLLAAIEVGSFFTTQERVVDEDDWNIAGGFVREGIQPERDVAVTAPRWADPLLRRTLGDNIDVSAAGRSDLAAYERVWALTIRGHDPMERLGSRTPTVDRWFGRVRVRRWDLGPSPVRFDFVEHIQDADVQLVMNGVGRPCPWRRTGFPYGGGVLQGPMTPAERFVCPSHPWLWVARTVLEDLDLQTRECIWQHPQGSDPVRTTFRNVPLGERLVFYGGIYHGHEHSMTGGPVYADIAVNGRRRGRFVHQDGNGWSRLDVETRALEDAARHPDARGEISVEVTAPVPHLRTFCWAATIRSGPRAETRLARASPGATP